jgi:HAD superfamily hydrolase (TIGR01459 family)
MNKRISGINAIIDKYDFFILDIWGVIHNGMDIYPGVKDTLLRLKNAKKQFCFLSNSPRPNAIVHAKFVSIGLDFIAKDQIITSGDYFRYAVQSGNYQHLQNSRIYALDAEKNKDILKDLELNMVDDVAMADYFVIMSFTADLAKEEPRYKAFFERALKLNLTAICPNPDRLVNDGKEIKYVNGHFAQMYQKMGGKVLYFGKPHIGIYQHLAQQFTPKLERTLAVGDSIETDITGANKFNIDSLLIMGGIHAGEKNIEKLFDLYNAQANYISEWFSL